VDDLTISIEEVIRQRPAPTFDLRPLEERDSGMGFIPGATWCSTEGLLARIDELVAVTRASSVVLVCLSGRRSDDAAQRLRDRGVPRVYSLRGGILAWRAAGHPVCGTGDIDDADVPDLEDAEAFVVAIRSCFVAEWAQNSADDDAFNPVELVQEVFARAPRTRAGLVAAVDEVARVAWRRGHPLAAMVKNVDRMHAALQRLARRGGLAEG